MATLTSDISHEHRVFTSLDGMRFVAALLVVTNHVSPVFGTSFLPESYLAVDLFFVLSGFVVANAYELKLLAGSMNTVAFLRVRAIRLYPLYFLGIMLGLLVSILGISNWIPARAYGAVQLAYHGLASLFLIPNPEGLGPLFPLDNPIWSLFLEVVVNVAYVLGLRRLVGGKLVMLIAVAALALVAKEAFLHTNLNGGWTLKSLPLGIARVTFSFYAGVLIYRIDSRVRSDRRRTRWGNTIPWLLVTCVAAILTCHLPSLLTFPFEIMIVTCLFPGLVLIGIRYQPTGGTARIFRLGGQLSYAIYVLHEPIGALFVSACETVPRFNVEAHRIWAGSILMVLLVAICLAVDAFYDIPIRRAVGRFRVAVSGPSTTASIHQGASLASPPRGVSTSRSNRSVD